jgi:hypothetical protein
MQNFARILVVSAAAAVLGSSGAFAQQLSREEVAALGCECFTNVRGSQDRPVGSVRSSVGSVDIFDRSSTSRPGVPGEALVANERVVTGEQSEAVVQIGTCRQSLGPLKELLVQGQRGGICLLVSDASAPVSPGISPLVPAIGGLAVLGTGIALAADGGGDDPVWFDLGDGSPISR